MMAMGTTKSPTCTTATGTNPTATLDPEPARLLQAAEKGPDARRRPTAAGEAYSVYVEPAAEGANEADGPLSAACS